MNLFEYILDWLYPPRCVFCQSILPINGERGVCIQCREEIPYIEEPTCERCGKSLSMHNFNSICHDCMSHTHFYEKGWAIWVYEGHVREAIHRFKYGNHPEYGEIFGKMMAAQFRTKMGEEKFDLIIPVPMYKKKQKQRGYNQAEVLAKVIGKQLGIPVDTNVLLRIKSTKTQSGLSLRERQSNLKNAFQVMDENKITAKKILLIDDIYTTGSTIDHCSQVLLRHHGERVYFLSMSIGVDSL